MCGEQNDLTEASDDKAVVRTSDIPQWAHDHVAAAKAVADAKAAMEASMEALSAANKRLNEVYQSQNDWFVEQLERARTASGATTD